MITQERANELIAEAEARTGVTVDLTKNTLTLTDEERARQEEQKRRQEELQRQAEEAQQAKEAERRQNEELLRALEEARRAKEEANRLAEEERRQSAEAAYLAQLSEEERQRFEEDRNELAAGDTPQTPEPPVTSEPTGPSDDSGPAPQPQPNPEPQPEPEPQPDPGQQCGTAFPEAVEQILIKNTQGQEMCVEFLGSDVRYPFDYNEYDTVFAYRVLVDESEDFIDLEVDFEEIEELYAIQVFEYYQNEYGGQKYAESEPISESDAPGSDLRYIYRDIPLDSPITLLKMEYNLYEIQDMAFWIAIVKGESPTVDLGMNRFFINFAETEFKPALIINDDIYVTAGYDISDWDLYTFAYLNDEPYATYKVLLENGDVAAPSTFMGHYELPYNKVNSEWNHLKVLVTDVAQLLPERTYNLHIYSGPNSGKGVPEGFEGVKIATSFGSQLEPDAYDPAVFEWEVDDNIPEVQFEPVIENPELELEAVYAYDGTEIEKDMDGKYTLQVSDFNEENWIWLLFRNGDEKFVYYLFVKQN